MKIKIGDTVDVIPHGRAKVESIKICRPMEKYGIEVSECDTNTLQNVIVTLDNNHWRYIEQIKSIN